MNNMLKRWYADLAEWRESSEARSLFDEDRVTGASGLYPRSFDAWLDAPEGWAAFYRWRRDRFGPAPKGDPHFYGRGPGA